MKSPINNPAATIEDFNVVKVLGQGSYGKVFLILHKQTKKYHAMKVIKKELVFGTRQNEELKSERDNNLTMFDNPFIMKFEYTFQDQNNLYMVMEFVNGGELFQHNKNGFSQHIAKFYAVQIVLALEHMHKEGVVYRNLKPKNVLIDSEGYLRLTDFGLSKVANQSEEKYNRTMAPDLMQNMNYGNSVDWFSFGILLFEMLCGKNPLKNKEQEPVSS